MKTTKTKTPNLEPGELYTFKDNATFLSSSPYICCCDIDAVDGYEGYFSIAEGRIDETSVMLLLECKKHACQVFNTYVAKPSPKTRVAKFLHNGGFLYFLTEGSTSIDVTETDSDQKPYIKRVCVSTSLKELVKVCSYDRV